ncbi:dihydroxyacetone kinase phosphoryl donor subunit DhaM [Pontibacillus salicampi]|uniref:phosphoenolpyruvate--glycerone phosphotransferase n=1 Tax=Pontibacillus salicampi TaxID=1449801 RepID=A0ABV6LQH5_9BACI
MELVGIVLVSHSEKVVEGTKDILKQVVGDVPIAIAGGTDDGSIGTSIDKIQAAIEGIHSEKGTLLFYDIGSARMNAEMALEMMDLQSIDIAEAPLVEGAYLAAVESSMDKPLEAIQESLYKEYSS